MKRILVGTALALFGLVPATGSADCSEDHASTASSTASKPELAQAPAASKALPQDVAKASVTKQVKPAAVKKKSMDSTIQSSSKADGSAVVARTY